VGRGSSPRSGGPRPRACPRTSRAEREKHREVAKHRRKDEGLGERERRRCARHGPCADTRWRARGPPPRGRLRSLGTCMDVVPRSGLVLHGGSSGRAEAPRAAPRAGTTRPMTAAKPAPQCSHELARRAAPHTTVTTTLNRHPSRHSLRIGRPLVCESTATARAQRHAGTSDRSVCPASLAQDESHAPSSIVLIHSISS